MNERRVIRLSWDEWRAGRAALDTHGLSGESRRTSARPETHRQLQILRNKMDSLLRVDELAMEQAHEMYMTHQARKDFETMLFR